MEQSERLDYLINYLNKEQPHFTNVVLPVSDKKQFFRALCNIRGPYEISDDFIKIQNDYLQEELKQKKITDERDINFIEDKMALWQGDITTLKVDAIVNAGNSTFLGCFIPNHNCIDNAIHSFAGVQLRNECNDIMNGSIAKTSDVIITKAYNLPSKYIIHTLGPIIFDTVSEKEINLLKQCYLNCLNLAKENNIKTLAFCSISTGEFHFPIEQASKIAVNTVRSYLKDNSNAFDKIIFNVFSRGDYDVYKKLFEIR